MPGFLVLTIRSIYLSTHIYMHIYVLGRPLALTPDPSEGAECRRSRAHRTCSGAGCRALRPPALGTVPLTWRGDRPALQAARLCSHPGSRLWASALV